ncbi:Acb2/Tad1 domain-containing protein [Burkholderia gladioli]|uniref:Acb2/Tad1 domain-containing protein n=1 Tax=Burkholderia gladioli TaxID=28095 RepID=UPI003EE11C6A
MEKHMENQHRAIKGYRELTAAEIDLMNRIKAAGAELLALYDELKNQLDTQYETKREAAKRSLARPEAAGVSIEQGATDECREIQRFLAAEPHRWAEIARTDIQTGVMALVRAVAQPAT